MDFTCCGPCNVLTAEELSEANAVASERVEVVKFKDTSSTFSRFCCSRRRPQRGTVREVTLSSAEHAWRSNYGRYKYCGLRPDPCRGKPPEMQDMHRVSQLRSPDVVDVAGVQKLQRRLADLSDCRTDFGTLLRFYREGDGKPPAAEEAFRAAMDWQRQHDVGRALTHWNLELYERVLAPWWPSGGFLGHGREGEPVALERLGRADWSTLYDNVPYEVLQKMDIVHCLRTLSGCEEDALRRGEAFVNATLVQDLEGISWSRFKPSSLKTLGKLLKTRMYLVPRTGRRVLIVNAPPAFVRVWSTIKNLVVPPGDAALEKSHRVMYQLTCRLAFLMNLSFLCVVLFSVTRPDADESWQSLLNVFGTLFALQFSAVIAVPMLCSVLGRKARVWRQHFCLQLMACLAPIFWLGGKLGACLCRVLLFLKGCCGLCELCCGKLPDEEAPEEAPDAPMQQTMSEGGRRASTDKSGRRGSTGRRGSSETGSRRGSFGTGRRGSTETGSRRGSTGTGRGGSTGTGRRGSTETGRRGSRDSGQRGSKDSGPKDSKESGHRASPDGRRSSTQSSHRGSDLGSGGSGGYTLGEDDDLMGFPSEESDSTFLFSEGGDSVSSDVMHEVQKFRMERKQVRSPTTPLRSAGLAFKSEDEVFSYPVGRRKKPRRASSDSRAGSAAEVEEAWTKEVPKKKRRRRSQKGGRRASGGGGFFRSLLGSKEELTVVKEMSLNSQQSTGSTRSRRGNSPGSPGRRSSLGSLGTHSSSSSHRRKDSKGSKGSKGSRTNSKSSRLAQLGSASRSFFQRLLSRRRSSVEEPMGYDPKTYDAAAWRAAQGRNTSSFSPMQVRNLRAPDLLAPPMLHEISDLGSTTEGWGWSKVSWGQATDSQSRMVTKDAKDLRSEDVP